jgi:hypothetical protein
VKVYGIKIACVRQLLVKMNHLPLIRTAIREVYGCDCEHIATHEVSTVVGDVRWTGLVEQFTLMGYPYCKHAFGWMEETSRKGKPCVILQMWPVETPEAAVQAVFEREFRARMDDSQPRGGPAGDPLRHSSRTWVRAAINTNLQPCRDLPKRTPLLQG